MRRGGFRVMSFACIMCSIFMSDKSDFNMMCMCCERVCVTVVLSKVVCAEGRAVLFMRPCLSSTASLSLRLAAIV